MPVHRGARTERGWSFRSILNDRSSRPTRRGKRKHEVLILWDSGERTWEPIEYLWTSTHNKFLLAEYAKEHGKLDDWDRPGMRIKEVADRNRLMVRMVNKAKLESYKSNTVYMFGHEVPRNHGQALELDRKNNNTKWADSEKVETDQLLEYEVFEDLGHHTTARAPEGYKKITLHFVYARWKAQESSRSRRASNGNTNRECLLRCGITTRGKIGSILS